MNILLQTLSLLNPRSLNEKTPSLFKCNYEAKSRLELTDKDYGERYFSQCEPALLSVAHELHEMSQKDSGNRPEAIDRIIVFCSPETYADPRDEKTDSRNRHNIPLDICFGEEEKYEYMNSMTFYERRIRYLLRGKYTYEIDGKQTDIYEDRLSSAEFISFEKIAGDDRFARAKSNEELVVKVAEMIRSHFDEKPNSRLYIDTQGGSRSDMFFLLSIVRLLKIRGISPDRILLCDYNPNETAHPVYDKKKEYSVFDLPSGIDEFINYAKAKQLKKFFTDSGATSNEFIRETLEIIEDIANAIQICNMEEFRSSLNRLREKCEKKENANNVLFKYVLDEIQNDYEELLKPGGDTFLNIINWCIRKEFYQQALTLLENDTINFLCQNKFINAEKIIDAFQESDKIKECFLADCYNRKLWPDNDLPIDHSDTKIMEACTKLIVNYYIPTCLSGRNEKNYKEAFECGLIITSKWNKKRKERQPVFKTSVNSSEEIAVPIIIETNPRLTVGGLEILSSIYYQYIEVIKPLRNSNNHGDNHISFSEYTRKIKRFTDDLNRLFERI